MVTLVGIHEDRAMFYCTECGIPISGIIGDEAPDCPRCIPTQGSLDKGVEPQEVLVSRLSVKQWVKEEWWRILLIVGAVIAYWVL